MGYAIPQTLRMADQECINCGTPFAMAETLLTQRKKDKQSFYCPNGHPQAFIESESDRLRKMLNEANARNTALTDAVTRAQNERQQARQAEQRAVKETKRLKRRIQGGVCTCCNRTFQNLARHMATKHAGAQGEPLGCAT